MATILLFVIVLGLLVFVHEFGHFIVAKKSGVHVEEFGFGFPPRIFGIRRGRDGAYRIVWGNKEQEKDQPTVYSLNWLPVGGFVRITGEGGEERDRRDSFASRPLGVKIAIIAAGVIMNFVLAVVLVGIGLSIGTVREVPDNVSKYVHVSDRRLEVQAVVEGSPASKSDIRPGDRLQQVAGVAVGTPDDFRSAVALRADVPMVVTIERDGSVRDIRVTPTILEQTGKPGIGIAFADVAMVRYPIWLAFPKAFVVSGQMVGMIFGTLGTVIHDLALGNKVSLDVAGPVGIAVMTGQAAKLGWLYLIQFVAVLSLNLAVINVFPFPALDGGRILFLLLEKARRRPLNQKIEALIHNIGFMLLLGLVALVTYRDLAKFGGSIGGFFKRLF